MDVEGNVHRKTRGWVVERVLSVPWKGVRVLEDAEEQMDSNQEMAQLKDVLD